VHQSERASWWSRERRTSTFVMSRAEHPGQGRTSLHAPVGKGGVGDRGVVLVRDIGRLRSQDGASDTHLDSTGAGVLGF
jgi:hypothetical protein